MLVVVSVRTLLYGGKLIYKHINSSLSTGAAIRMNESVITSFSELRQPYNSVQDVFDVKDLVSKEPYANFRHWFDEACNCKNIYEPNAMAIATATLSGMPSVRMVLMKGYDRSGFKFFTNYNSRKGRELAENPRASLMFFWDPLKKSIRVEGMVEKLHEEESVEYFHSRPKSSQISACASNQSSVVASRQVLVSRKEELSQLYSDESQQVPKPEAWGGYLLRPDYFEFWQGQSDRLHDRIVFRRRPADEAIDSAVTNVGEDGWVYERLSP